MGFLLFLLVVVIAVGMGIFIGRYISNVRDEDLINKEVLSSVINPKDIGLLSTFPKSFLDNFNNSLDEDYLKRVIAKFRKEHPNVSKNELDDYLRELKRFLILAGVFKSVEMFNPMVDELWHEMLEFDLEYKTFCNNFIGREITHVPHGNPIHKPEERTWFDILYIRFFTIDDISRKVWYRFFYEGNGKDQLYKINDLSMSELKNLYLLEGTSEEAEAIFESFVYKIKGIILDIKNKKKSQKYGITYKNNNKTNEPSNVSDIYFAYVEDDFDSISDKKDFEVTIGDSSSKTSYNDYTSTFSSDNSGGSSKSSCSSCSSGSDSGGGSSSSCSSCSS